MRKIATATALMLSAGLLSGCFNIEQGLKLNKDLSGEAGVTMALNMEPMALLMLSMQREMSGQTGEPTPAEIEKAKQDLLASSKSRTTDKFPPKMLIEKALPEGVKLLDTSISEEGLRMTMRFSLAFDNVAKLSQINLPGEKQANVLGANPMDQPFPFDIKDEGGTLLLTMQTKNPVGERRTEKPDTKVPPGLQKQIDAAFKDVRLAFKLETPLEVVEHNATRKEGQTLVWEYDAKALEKMTPEQLAQGVRVRLRK
jgi:hypothetical protein